MTEARVEALGGWRRTHSCGDLRSEHIGQSVTLMGWAFRRRDHGGLIFLDLRDREGLTQCVFNPAGDSDAHGRAESVRGEFVLAVRGTVGARPPGTENPKLATGAVAAGGTMGVLIPPSGALIIYGILTSTSIGQLFAAGIIGTGMLAIPVLAGSAAYAVGEALGWPVGLDRKLQKAKRFYACLGAAVIIGFLINLSGMDAMKALIGAAILNGIVAVPLMALLMIMGSNRKIMGTLTLPASLRLAGWTATVLMARWISELCQTAAVSVMSPVFVASTAYKWLGPSPCSGSWPSEKKTRSP